MRGLTSILAIAFLHGLNRNSIGSKRSPVGKSVYLMGVTCSLLMSPTHSHRQSGSSFGILLYNIRARLYPRAQVIMFFSNLVFSHGKTPFGPWLGALILFVGKGKTYKACDFFAVQTHWRLVDKRRDSLTDYFLLWNGHANNARDAFSIFLA